MASLIHGLDNHTPKQVGENGHVEHGWSHNIDEKIVQFFFQLVRSNNHSDLECQHRAILHEIKGKEREFKNQFITMYKLIGQTRDIVSGKGEQQLAFMQIYGFYESGYADLAASAFFRFLVVGDAEHPYGSYKDVKYLCKYLKEKTGREDHPLIEFVTNLLLNALENDYSQYEEWKKDETQKKPILSLAGKWCPREKSREGWVHAILAKKRFNQYLITAKSRDAYSRAVIKCKIHFTKIIVTLNKYLETTQCKQASGDWSNIKFNSVTSCTMRKQSRAFANKTKKGEQRSTNDDRVNCASNYVSHLEAAKSDPKNHKVHGRRCNVGELTKDACLVNQNETAEVDRINLQWESNKDNNKGLGNMIACVDTSGSMECDEGLPIYNAVGLGIRCSEVTSDAFKHRVMTFSTKPQWITLNDKSTFVEKAKRIRIDPNWSGSTNIAAMFDLILDVIIKNDIPPSSVEDLILGIFSDMQIDYCGTGNLNTLYDDVSIKFQEAGLKSKFGVVYPVPHILMWNLRKTNGFPVLSTQKNVTMMSGYSSTLLNTLSDKGVNGLKEFTPARMLQDILNNKRYDILDNDLYEYYYQLKK
jgi:hypothetical protein